MPTLSGHRGGHDTNLRQYARDGIALAGRLTAGDGERASTSWVCSGSTPRPRPPSSVHPRHPIPPRSDGDRRDDRPKTLAVNGTVHPRSSRSGAEERSVEGAS
jgi:hypothetical protein